MIKFQDINSDPQRTVLPDNIRFVDFAKNGHVVGVNPNEIFLSRDFRESWVSILYNLPEQGPDADPELDWIYDFAISDDNYLYVSLADGSIYINKEILNSSSVNTSEINNANYASVYPNPVTEHADFMITSTEELSQLSLKIFDLNGKIIHTTNSLVSGQSYRWHTKGHTSGVYFYQLHHNGRNIQSGKIMLK